MTTIQKNSLTDAEKRAVGRLVDACNQYDRTEMGIYLGTEFNLYAEMNCFFLYYEDEDAALVGFLSADAEEAGEADIKGCVLPERRREGIFRRLYDFAREELARFGITRVNLVSQKSFLEENDVMSAFGAELYEEEYQMRYVGGNAAPVRRADAEVRLLLPEETARGADILARAFEDDLDYALNYVSVACGSDLHRAYAVCAAGEVVGLGCVDLSGGADGFVYGLCVDPDEQRKGYGARLLTEMVAHLREAGIGEITLRVDSDNAKALPLYLGCGFEVTSTVQYYRVATNVPADDPVCQ